MNLQHIKKMRPLILATAKRYVEIETERYRQQDKAFTALAKATASYAHPEAAGDEIRRQVENNATDNGNTKAVAKAITEALIIDALSHKRDELKEEEAELAAELKRRNLEPDEN